MDKRPLDPDPKIRRLQKLYCAFNSVYKELRKQFLKCEPGGSITMELNVKDAGAEAEFQRRSKAARKRRR